MFVNRESEIQFLLERMTSWNRHPEGASQKGLPYFFGRDKRQPSSWAFFEIRIHEGNRGPWEKG